jgi:hypothetical protein
MMMTAVGTHKLRMWAQPATSRVLELAKQLLALNTSAKQLPATSVISITTP